MPVASSYARRRLVSVRLAPRSPPSNIVYTRATTSTLRRRFTTPSRAARARISCGDNRLVNASRMWLPVARAEAGRTADERSRGVADDDTALDFNPMVATLVWKIAFFIAACALCVVTGFGTGGIIMRKTTLAAGLGGLFTGAGIGLVAGILGSVAVLVWADGAYLRGLTFGCGAACGAVVLALYVGVMYLGLW